MKTLCMTISILFVVISSAQANSVKYLCSNEINQFSIQFNKKIKQSLLEMETQKNIGPIQIMISGKLQVTTLYMSILLKNHLINYQEV